MMTQERLCGSLICLSLDLKGGDEIPKLITLMILTAMNFLSICSLFALDVFLVGETSFAH